MNLPFHASHIVIYEKLSQMLNPERKYNAKVHMIAGACAGAFAAGITTPLDVCKTLLNTQEYSTLKRLKQSRVVGIESALKTIYSMQGFVGFFKGMQARILYQMPGTAISWSVYELFKHHMFESNKSTPDSSYDHQELIREGVVRTTSHEKGGGNHHTSYDGGTGRGLFGPEKLYAITSTSKMEQIRSLPVTTPLTASCSSATEDWR